jgi:hypothetical protein
MTETWFQLGVIWCLLWWFYAAYQLLVPKDGGSVFYADEPIQQRVMQMIIWAVMIFTAPVWCPFHAIASGESP